MPPGSDDEEDLKEQVKKLNARIAELETMLGQFQEPFRKLYGAAQNYYKFVDLYMKYGEVSPELTVPDLKDPISKDIIVVLFEKNGQNTSQITDAVKAKRGSASRRIIREKLGKLEEGGYVRSEQTKKAVIYYLSDELVKKWSEVLGFSK